MDNKMIAFIVAGLLVGVAVGAAVGYVLFDEDDNNDETYSFYLYFDAENDKNGWYSATATSPSNAFSKAMDKANLDYNVNSSGYLSSIDGVETYWMMYQYLYSETTEDAALNSVGYPIYDVDYGFFSCSNGWFGTNGYDAEVDFKIDEFSATIYFVSTGTNPVTTQDWMSGGPFA